MKSSETKTTATAQQLSKGERQPFFQKEKAGSALDNGQPSFFFANGSVGTQHTPFFFGKPTVQTKLRIGQPGDKYEQEADRMADQLVQRLTENENGNGQRLTARSGLQRKPIFESESEPEVQTKSINGHASYAPQVQRKCTECEREENLQNTEDQDEVDSLHRKAIFDSAAPPPEEDGEDGVQRKSNSMAGAGVLQPKCAECADGEGEAVQRKKTTESTTSPRDGLSSRLASSKGDGFPLPKNTRVRMEGAFGADFSNVRIHTDSRAERMNQSVQAHAFTHGSDIYFNSGKYDTTNTAGQKLLAHELTHVVQQDAANSALPAARRTDAPMLQRAIYALYDSAPHLLLWIPFGNDHIFHHLILDPDVANFFDSDPQLAQSVENDLGQIFNPPDRALHETGAYLQSAAVLQLIVRGVRQLVTTGRANFSELAELLRRRTDLFYKQTLLPAATSYLAGALGLDPAMIDWNVLTPALHAQAKKFEPTSVIDAALRDRYEMFLDMLGNEAAALPPVVGSAVIDPAAADYHLFAYVTNQGSALFTKDVFAYHSEKFVNEYLPLLEAIRYVPEQFDLQAFQPAKDTSRIDATRERIVADFIAREGESRVMIYILDRWAASGASPEEFLSKLDLERFRQEITTYLAEELIKQARNDPELMAAVRSRVTDQARFTQVTSMVSYGRSLEQHNRSLADTFLVTPLANLSPEDHAIAADPYAYYNISLQISAALNDLFNRLSPNAPIELQTVSAAASVLSALDMPSGYAALFLLPELLGYLAAFRNVLEEQERQTQRALKERLDLDFEKIASVVRAFAEHADRYVRETWIPMLKQIAIEFATANRDDLKYQDENWEALRSSRIIEFAQGAAELEFMANELESGRATEVEVEGKMVGRDGVAHLRNAAGTLRAAGLRELDEKAKSSLLASIGFGDPKREKLRGAVADYDQVIEDILDGTYNPLDYSSAVYAEARRRLGIEYIEGVTVGIILRRSILPAKNPFLEYAIVRWHYFEGVERSLHDLNVLFALGLLTLAAALIPGAVGVVLGAIDIGLGIGTGVKGVLDARDTLRMARLDIYGTIVGVSEADAEAALRHAWINLGVTIVITAGVGALQARAYLHRPGGVRQPRSGPAVGVSRAEGRLLSEAGELHGSQLSPQQLNAEAQVASRSPTRPSRLAGYEEEILLPNDHTWRRRGNTWCRFSFRPFCMPDATLPQALRRRAYRDVAKTLDEGVNASGSVISNRGHSYADHGAHTTPEQHEHRLRTGFSPSGRNTRLPDGSLPNASSRFATHRAQLDAYQLARDDAARQILAAGSSPPNTISRTLDLPGAGSTYTIDGGSLVRGNLVGGTLRRATVDRFRYVFRRNVTGSYDLITMFPEP
jgi:hypothetical protein